MTYVVNDNCVMCKHTDCVEVCPVDCFHEGENMLVINPDECIDCGACEPECPVDAIKHEADESPKWLEINTKYAELWSTTIITEKKEALPDAEKYAKEENKFEKYFSDKPAK